ncbi:hypothetical protein ETB97_001430 [Aspergillus alliaceus]|uniref:Uncharacterized protein n=1 Tax=Petromyces alliaceus TaxID=209559 RepID=A0A5N6FWD2_PETAA|nr:uncharacterized protein BDW43DRAFT_310575 [Aspergillus alliaceus]KAB8234222.1 hypothetical protein BDW43DRAFT_310575 [Aspergillus alliaceus]KAF5860530.1 hypothetical protein ETB97_001430 [Aspergillus burnettii]
MPIIFSSLLVALLSLGSVQAKPANWLYTSDLDNEAQKLLDRPDISGVQTLYTWKSLEPQKDTYDFSAIHNDLNLTTSKGKHLWIQLQDRSFNIANDPVPSYLYHPIYNNGSVPQCDAPDCEENFIPGGWAAAHWNPFVRVRFQRLLDALAKDLDGKIYGLNLPETAIEVQMNNTQTNFTCEAYFRGELENAKHAAKAFRQSYVVQYVNFWPCGWANENQYLSDSFEFFGQNGIGVGGPDNIPYKKTLENNAYPFMDAYRNQVPISVVAVQEPDLKAVNPKTNRPFTKEEFVVFAEGRLGVDVIFWALSSPWLHL